MFTKTVSFIKLVNFIRNQLYNNLLPELVVVDSVVLVGVVEVGTSVRKHGSVIQ